MVSKRTGGWRFTAAARLAGAPTAEFLPLASGEPTFLRHKAGTARRMRHVRSLLRDTHVARAFL